MTLTRPTTETSAFIQFGELSYYLAFAHAVKLRKVQLEEHEDGWRARIKVKGRRGYLITYLAAPTYTRLILLIGQLSDKSALAFYPDSYP